MKHPEHNALRYNWLRIAAYVAVGLELCRQETLDAQDNSLELDVT